MRIQNSSFPGWKEKLGLILACLGLLGALLSAPRIARANSGVNFFETVGISVAVGTVLGASTLPFYSQPGSQLMNLVYGASLGTLTGLGIWLFQLSGSSQEKNSRSLAKADQFRLRVFIQDQPVFWAHSWSATSQPSFGTSYYKYYEENDPTAIWTPLVSLSW